MATAERRAEIYWEGELDQGVGGFNLGDWMVGEPARNLGISNRTRRQ